MILYLNRIRAKKYRDLSKEEIAYLREMRVLNGFGGASQSWLVRWLIGLLLSDFDKAIPDYHDFGYFVGGDEKRRLECDEKFYQAMLDDIRARYDTKIIGKWGVIGKSLIALCAYQAIRWKGSKYFQYRSIFYS